ncbi:MAG: hypothetical protein DBX51_00830 [Clostridiales bacterium]|nr:MAG: hypothetical protein DBX51_00830 [Clostridiales bacterium]
MARKRPFLVFCRIEKSLMQNGQERAEQKPASRQENGRERREPGRRETGAGSGGGFPVLLRNTSYYNDILPELNSFFKKGRLM